MGPLGVCIIVYSLWFRGPKGAQNFDEPPPAGAERASASRSSGCARPAGLWGQIGAFITRIGFWGA